LLVAQRPEHDNLIDSVHELRRKFASRSLDRSALNLVVKIAVDFHRFRRETETTID